MNLGLVGLVLKLLLGEFLTGWCWERWSSVGQQEPRGQNVRAQKIQTWLAPVLEAPVHLCQSHSGLPLLSLHPCPLRLQATAALNGSGFPSWWPALCFSCLLLLTSYTYTRVSILRLVLENLASNPCFTRTSNSVQLEASPSACKNRSFTEHPQAANHTQTTVRCIQQ